MHLTSSLRQQCRWWFYQSWERSLVLWQRPRTLTRGEVCFGTWVKNAAEWRMAILWVASFKECTTLQCSCIFKNRNILFRGVICSFSYMFPTWLFKAFSSFLIIFDPSPMTGPFQIGRFPVDQFLRFSKEVTPQLMVELEELVPPYVPSIIEWRDGFDGKQIHAGQK